MALAIPSLRISLIRAGKPALVAVTKAIPPPIKPPPNTPTFFKEAGCTPSIPVSFFISVVAKNKLLRAADSELMTKLPKCWASTSKPFLKPLDNPVSIQSMISAGDG